jgi:hypothetical protein
MMLYFKGKEHIMGASSSNFFKVSQEPIGQENKQAEAIYVGGNQFHVAAVALIDYFQSNVPFNIEVAKKLLNRFSQCFPNVSKENNNLLLKPKEYLNRLLHMQVMELVGRMAYVLQQLAVDELYAHYLELTYRPVFKELTSDTSKNYLRDPRTTLPVCALKALAKILGLPLSLSFKEPGKGLRKEEKSTDCEQAVWIIQIQKNTCYPVVKNKEYFNHMGQLVISSTYLELANEQGTLAEILAAIKEDNLKRLRVYEQQSYALATMIKAKELSYEQLLTFYTTLLPNQVNDSSQFIRELVQDACPTLVKGMPDEQQEALDLGNALASWIAAGSINKEELFDQIDNLPSPRLRLK